MGRFADRSWKLHGVALTNCHRRARQKAANRFQGQNGSLIVMLRCSGAHRDDGMRFVVTMRVSNPDCSPVGINRWDATPTPTGFAKIVSDDLPVLHAQFTAFDPSR